MDANVYDKVFGTCLAVLHQKISVQEFGQWLLTTDIVWQVLGVEVYEALLEIEYDQASMPNELVVVLLSVLHQHRPELYYQEYIRRIMCRLVNETIDVVDACAELASLHRSNHEWIPITFVGLDSEFDALESGAEDWIESYRQIAKQEAQALLTARFADIPCS